MKFLSQDKIDELLLIIGESLQGFNRKILYGFLLVLVAAIPVYFIAKTSFYNIAISTINAPKVTGDVERAPLEQLESQIIRISDNDYSGYVKIDNSNLEWGVPNLMYRLEIRSGSGELLASNTGSSYILPATEKFLIIPRFTATQTPVTVDLTLLNTEFALKPVEFPRLDLEVQRNQVVVTESETSANYVLRNSSPFTIGQVDLFSLIYNERQQIVGVSYTNVNDLLSGELRSFQHTWPAAVPGTLRAELITDINAFDRTILRTQGSASQFD